MHKKTIAETLLFTGFGPFPGAPVNPTQALVRRLARLPRGILGRTRLATHVFPVSYRAVDRNLAALIAEHRPLALLMFGLATRTPWLRLETRARNVIGSFRDADGQHDGATTIVAGHREALAFSHAARILLQPLRAAGLPVRMSRDAGRYLCNYLSWRALEHTTSSALHAPVFAVFIHVPPVATRKRPRGAPSRTKRQLSAATLDRAMPMLLRQTIILARREARRRKAVHIR